VDKISATQAALLGILTIKPMSAYEIEKFSKESIGFFWNESYGNIHKNLNMLNSKELVQIIELNSSRRLKKVYQISALGQSKLTNWIEHKPKETLIRNELLLKVFMSSEEDIDVLIAHLNAEILELRNHLKVLEQIDVNVDNLPIGKFSKILWKVTIDNGMTYCRATIDWCERTIQTIKQYERG
jgi:DNA-binding PadR family transcriptional regulator